MRSIQHHSSIKREKLNRIDIVSKKIDTVVELGNVHNISTEKGRKDLFSQTRFMFVWVTYFLIIY